MATIRRRGDKWQAQVRRNGLRGCSRTFHLRKDALAWARQVELQMDKVGLHIDTKILKTITLAQLVKRYRDTISIRKRGYEVERIVLTAFLRHQICRKHLSNLTAEDFAAYRDERLRIIKPTTLKRELSPLHNMFEVARQEWGLPVENPLTKLQLKILHHRRERRLRDGELDRLIRSAQKCRNKLVLPIILFGLETGMRRSEILKLRWDDFHPASRSMTLAESKNGHSRVIPLSTRALEILTAVPKTDARIFPTGANAFRLAWERVRARAGISNFHFHDFRHEAISRFFELGLSVPEVALISGHRDPRMLLRYTHPIREAILKRLL